MRQRSAAAMLTLSLLWAAAAAAQPGALGGGVVDGTGAPLPGASVTLSGPDGAVSTTYSDSGGAYRFGGLAPGTYSVAVELAGFSAASVEDIAVRDRPVALPRVALSLATFGDTVVVTASRTEVRVLDAPVTTSVLPQDALETTASASVGDALRAVPGLNVVQLSPRDVNVTSRSATGPAANSQLVLMDGRSVYLDFFGLVLWDLLTANPLDIRQVEVVRGPASATWGANAMTGAVNIITKDPREDVGTRVTFAGGWTDRDAGTLQGRGPGSILSSNATVTRAPSDTLAYRISGGYYRSDAYSRPWGRLPLVPDPRVEDGRVGGAEHPAYTNRGTAQPKFDARVDRTLADGARLSYSGGVAGTEGITHTGVGPFDITRGSYMGYAKIDYRREDLRAQFFTNFLDGDAPNALMADPATGEGVNLGFRAQTFDGEVSRHAMVGGRHQLTYGGNLRHNRFGVTIAPTAADRNEAGVYVQDEIDSDRYRVVLSGRADKFGNIARPFFSPRLAFTWKPRADHSLTLSYNRAFRAPSAVENFLEIDVVQPVDLGGLAAIGPLLPAMVPAELPPAAREQALARLQGQLDLTISQPFPLVVRGVGSDIAFAGVERAGVTEESVTACELSYTGTLRGGTTAGAAVYRNRRDDTLSFVELSLTADPYTAAEPPPAVPPHPGWVLPPQVLTLLGSAGVHFPRTAFTYANLGPTREWGIEAWADRRVSRSVSAWVNYSWQARPKVLDAERPFPITELSLPPTHRVNAGATLDGDRLLGNVSLSAATRAFWPDVLTSEYHGYSDGYTLVNGAFGVKWRGGTVTTLVKVTNLLNRSIQQHVFGDILRRTVVGEVRFDLP